MSQSIDLPLAISLIKFKHKQNLNHTYHEIINNIVLPNLQPTREHENIEPGAKTTSKSPIKTSIKPKKIREGDKAKPRGKLLLTILSTLNIDYGVRNLNEFIGLTSKLNIQIINLQDLANLVFALKCLIKSDNSSKSLYLIKVVCKQFDEITINTFNQLKYSQENNKISWANLFSTLDECLLLTVSFDNKFNNKINFKLSQLGNIYRSILSKFKNFKNILTNLFNEFKLNIFKLIVFKKFKKNIRNQCELADLIKKLNFNKTINDELTDFLEDEFSFNTLSLNFNKFDYLLNNHVKNHQLLNHLIKFYLNLIKLFAQVIKPTNLSLVKLRKQLLSFLLVNNDIYLIKYYSSINW